MHREVEDCVDKLAWAARAGPRLDVLWTSVTLARDEISRSSGIGARSPERLFNAPTLQPYQPLMQNAGLWICAWVTSTRWHGHIRLCSGSGKAFQRTSDPWAISGYTVQ